MRVRSLHTYLASENLINSGSLNDLKGTRVGIDAVYWLRTLPNLKDPLADAIGGLPLTLFSVLGTNLNLLQQMNLSPVFVFQGMQPPNHMMFSTQLHQQMDEAWRRVGSGDYSSAQHHFALATSRINSDFIFVVSRYLQSKGCQSFQAPYFAAAQLLYFAQEGFVDAVFGPPALLLFGIPRVITSINFQEKKFEWVELEQLLQTWNITEDQLLDACLLAGTEYCLTFPFLNPPRAQGGAQQFHFGTVVHFTREAPLISYMQNTKLNLVSGHIAISHQFYQKSGTFVSEYIPLYAVVPYHSNTGSFLKKEHTTPLVKRLFLRLLESCENFRDDTIRNEHSEGYSVCKTLIKYPLALYFDGKLRPVHRKPIHSLSCLPNAQGALPELTREAHEKATTRQQSTKALGNHFSIDSTPSLSAMETFTVPVPDDFRKIVGLNLPNAIFFLMARRFLSRKLPSVLALGEWWDQSHPTVDSTEYRDLLNDVQEYRRRALGLIAMHLHESFRARPIRFCRYTCTPVLTVPATSCASSLDQPPDCSPGMTWNFTLTTLLAEMKRQNVTKSSFKFCLKWHAHEASLGRQLASVPESGGANSRPLIDISDIRVFETLIRFMLLENLGYFTPEGGVTVFGSALASTNVDIEEDVLCVLELMKFGDLMGEPLEAPPDRPFPSGIKLLRSTNSLPYQRHILLLTRVVSLSPMQLSDSDLWLSPVDFDLAAFHSIVRALRKTFRHLSEACVSSVLLRDMNVMKVLPLEELSLKNPHFPTFMMPRNCMGIVFKQFLEFHYDPSRRPHRETPSGQLIAPSASRRARRLEAELTRFYYCCKDPMNDLFKGLRFWLEIRRIVELLALNIDVSVLKGDMDEAHEFLVRRIVETGLFTHPRFQSEEFVALRKEIMRHMPPRDVTSSGRVSAVSTSPAAPSLTPSQPGNAIHAKPHTNGVDPSSSLVAPAPSGPSNSSSPSSAGNANCGAQAYHSGGDASSTRLQDPGAIPATTTTTSTPGTLPATTSSNAGEEALPVPCGSSGNPNSAVAASSSSSNNAGAKSRNPLAPRPADKHSASATKDSPRTAVNDDRNGSATTDPPKVETGMRSGRKSSNAYPTDPFSQSSGPFASASAGAAAAAAPPPTTPPTGVALVSTRSPLKTPAPPQDQSVSVNQPTTASQTLSTDTKIPLPS